MKTATVKELKTELGECSHQELIGLCLRLSKFKKENKELLTYLLYESSNEDGYIEVVKEEISTLFMEINTTSFFYIKKSVRKILRITKKYIRYSGNKETEVILLLYFCAELKKMKPSMRSNTTLYAIYTRQIVAIRKTMSKLHEDLQYDYDEKLREM